MRTFTGFIFGAVLGLACVTLANTTEIVRINDVDPCLAAVEDIARTVEDTLRE